MFDAMVARSKRGEERSEEQIQGLDDKNDFLNGSDMEKKQSKNLSFDMNDLDDMRSADLQPSVAQNIKPSSANKQTEHKDISTPSSNGAETTVKSTALQNEKASTENGTTVPSWVAIAKEKHKRHNVEGDDEKELEDNKSSCQVILFYKFAKYV